MEPTRRCIKKRLNSREAYNAFLADIQANDTTDSLNQDPYYDPNQNNTLHNQQTKPKEKHLPYKFVKFNKCRHKGNKYITWWYSKINQNIEINSTKTINMQPDFFVFRS